MALIIGGHPRSGTTLLQQLCNGHPEMAVTYEHGSFLAVGQPFPVYRRQMVKRLWRTKHTSVLIADESSLTARLDSLRFGWRFIRMIGTCRGRRVELPDVEEVLRRLNPRARVVGDKYPRYVFILDRLAGIDGLARAIIYRDCRDVVISTLRRIPGDWRQRPWTRRFDTVEKVARLWVAAMESTDRNRDRVHLIRYEDLIAQPAEELGRLAEWLGVDPAGFAAHTIHGGSVGRHKDALAPADLATIEEIAGPTMARLGYS